MRIQFGKCIRFCTNITHSANSKLLIITTSNGVYTVDMETVRNAENVFKVILRDGYYDLSEYEYSN